MSSQKRTFGEPRHPTIHATASGEWVGEMTDPAIHRCESGGYTAVERYEELPAVLEEGATVTLAIFGTREGDADRVPFDVEAVEVSNRGGFEVTYRHDGEVPALDRWLDTGCIVCGTEPAAQEDAPTAAEVADELGVDVDRLEAFVEKLEEPTAAAVLGWATVAPGAIDTVEAWLESRDSEVNL
jgi:hypothetical protein